jgi:hypothetical protein
MEKQQKNHIIVLLVLHNNPTGCGASVASAAGSFNKDKLYGIESFLRT